MSAMRTSFVPHLLRVAFGAYWPLFWSMAKGECKKLGVLGAKGLYSCIWDIYIQWGRHLERF